MAKTTNSLLTQVGTIEVTTMPTARSVDDVSLPGTPKRWGRTALKPASTTRSAKSSTLGVIPGISAITMTAGPEPRRKTTRVLPSWVNVVRSKPDRSASAMAAT